MANSLMEIVSNGSLATIPLTIKFFEQAHISVFVNDTLLPNGTYTYVWSGASTVTISPVVTLGAKVSIRRKTPAAAMLHNFQAGAVFSEVSVDENFQQELFLLQEASEQSLVTDLFSDLDMHGNRIRNLSAGVLPGDAVNLAQAVTIAEGGGAFTLREQLASSTGTNLVGLATGSLTEHLAQKRGIDPRLPPYNYKATDSLVVRTTSLQSAYNDANTTKLGIVMMGAFTTSPISIVGHSDYTIYGTGTLTIIGGSGAGFEIKNCTGVKTSGSIIIAGNAGLACGVKVWGSGGTFPNFSTCSLHILEFSVVNCDLAWQFGDFSAPDNLLSEIVIRAGYTYNCRQVFLAVGSQTVIEFNGYQLIAVDGSVGSSLPAIGYCIGATVHINGGEVQIPGVPAGRCIVLRPLNSPSYDNKFGSCFINGAAVESAPMWLVADNSSAVADVVAGSGKFVMDNCSGFANYAGDNLQSDASFTGSVVITDTCEFHRTSPKPAGSYIAGCLGAARVKIADAAFDPNFNVGLQAFRSSSQRPQYGHRRIFTASNLGGLSFPQGANTNMAFTSASFTGENAFYYPAYNASTGIFTVPAGGLKSVKVMLEFNALAARPNSEVYLLIDGAQIGGVCGVSNKFVSQMFDVGDLSAGQTLRFRFQNLDTGFSVGTTNTDRFVISARTE